MLFLLIFLVFFVVNYDIANIFYAIAHTLLPNLFNTGISTKLTLTLSINTYELIFLSLLVLLFIICLFYTFFTISVGFTFVPFNTKLCVQRRQKLDQILLHHNTSLLHTLFITISTLTFIWYHPLFLLNCTLYINIDNIDIFDSSILTFKQIH